MPAEFFLSVVAPDKTVFEDKVTSVVAPGSEGYFGIQSNHLPLVAQLKPGLLEYVDSQDQRHYVYVGGGFAEVSSNHVTVLADEAELARDIDISRAEQSLDRARRALRGEPSDLNMPEALLEVERAMNRIKAARSVR